MINHPNRKKTAVSATGKPKGRSRTPAANKTVASLAYNHARDYPIFEKSVIASFQQHGATPFCTDATGLWDAYLDNLPKDRQTHVCHACRRFIENYGHLAVLDENGSQISLMWNAYAGMPVFYLPAVNVMRDMVQRAKITGPFYSSDKKWGLPVTGDWTHLHVIPPPEMLWKDRKLSAGQQMAAKREDFGTLARALADYDEQMLDEGLRVLSAKLLDRSEKFIPHMEWLRDLRARIRGVRGNRRNNLIWAAVAGAPAGWCSPRSGMIGTLLEDIRSGKTFDQIKKGFNAKVEGDVYQRPQAPPSAGNIKQAEKIVEKLGIARSLERRFARLDEVRKIWMPHDIKPVAKPGGGVFSHLQPKGNDRLPAIDLPPRIMTWAKFSTEILPTAEAIDFQVPMHGNFIAMTTAVHSDAPPILQWDKEDDRYPVSSYLYVGGSSARHWGLTGGHWNKVTAIVPDPGAKHQRVALILEGAVDKRESGSAIFPENLISDLHEIRATIEAHSRSVNLTGIEEASACGYAIPSGTLRVIRAGVPEPIFIDRWD